MSDDKVVKTMRLQSWERAKGELNALLNTYWGEEEKFTNMRREVEKFIRGVEDDGLVE